ncbi:PH domain-containing protein [Actinomycetospora sp. NBC_00405]|uniref:PH domain-containing protein n=1 Tax=Actinomycetospora sp. NBC_00405 TaxID=2975952 RepID=UPI002E1C18AF
MAYPDAVLRRGEHVLAHRRPHWRMLLVPAVVPPVAVFLAAFLAALAGSIPTGSTRTAVRLALVLLAVIAIVWLAVLPLVRWRCTHLVVTDRRLLVREGVLSRESVVVPGATITDVRTRRTSVLGAGTLIVSTAGTREPWEFVGLGDVERLASLVEGVADERGGLALAEADDDWGAWPSDDSDDTDGPEALEDGSDDDLVADDDGLEDEDEDDEEPAGEAAPVRRGRWRRRAARTSR